MKHLLFFNGPIITMTGERAYPEAIGVTDGRITYVGSLAEAKQSADQEETEYIDLQGHTLMPAFIDAHSHIMEQAEFFQYADLRECRSFQDIIDTLRQYQKAHHVTAEGIIVGVCYDHNQLKEKRHPDKFVLDQVSKDIPIYIRHTSSHMGVGNSKLLALAGITENTPDPEGAKFGRVKNSRIPDGYTEELAAMAYCTPIITERSHPQWEKLVEKAEAYYASYGVTTAQDGATTTKSFNILRDVSKTKKLPLDIVCYIKSDEDPEAVMAHNPEYTQQYHDRLKIGGWKNFLDGSPQGKTAWLSKPYEHSGTYCGYPAMKDEELTKNLVSALNHGRQVLAHCNGDAASEQYIRCYEKALALTTNKKAHLLRPVMVHCQTVRTDQLDRMVKLHMLPSVFVAHTYYWGDVHLRNLGVMRGSHISPVKDMVDRHMIYNFHRDTPVVPINMLNSVWAAVNRLTKTGKVIGPEERIDVYDALKGITCNAAYAYGEETQKGTLEVGKLADLVILDRNPLTVPAIQLQDIRVLKTFKEGQLIYEK